MNSIQLSDALLDDLQRVVARYEPEAEQDAGITVQYLAAVMGYLVADLPAAPDQRREFLDHLHGLANHVLEDREKSAAQAASAAPAGPAGHIEPSPDDPAMGIWRADKA